MALSAALMSSFRGRVLMSTRRGEGHWADILRIGALGGLLGGAVIWVYEAIVWAGVQHLLPLTGIPANAVGLVFGKPVQIALGPAAYLLGTAIDFAFALTWGVLFALIWPFFRRRGVEATLVELFYAIVAWIVMHVAFLLHCADGAAGQAPDGHV